MKILFEVDQIEHFVVDGNDKTDLLA